MVFVSFLVALLVKDFKCPGKRTNDFSGLCLVIKVSVLSCLKSFKIIGGEENFFTSYCETSDFGDRPVENKELCIVIAISVIPLTNRQKHYSSYLQSHFLPKPKTGKYATDTVVYEATQILSILSPWYKKVAITGFIRVRNKKNCSVIVVSVLALSVEFLVLVYVIKTEVKGHLLTGVIVDNYFGFV